jgi:hypothetical protein
VTRKYCKRNIELEVSGGWTSKKGGATGDEANTLLQLFLALFENQSAILCVCANYLINAP